jgi:quinol monooxygenase YgiN
MIGVIATLKIQPGKGPEFEAVFAELAAKVRADEPGNVLYQLTRSRTEADTYKVLELYKDQAAFDAHGVTEHAKAIFPKMGAFLAAPFGVDLLDTVG